MKPVRKNYPRRAALHDDLAQLDLLLKEAIAKLSGSFVGAHEALARQQSLVGHANPECAALAQVACAHLDSALTALQFEDIASQLIASARRHLRSSCSSGDGSRGVGSGDGTHMACVVNHSVPQQHMESGSIELF